jgi:hypothetical protein
MNFNSDHYSLVDIKKMFNILDNVNFFKEFTLQDVDLVKKKLYLYYKNEYPMRDKQIQDLLDVLSNRLVEDQFSLSHEKPKSVLVKNTVKDNLNPNYKNTISRVTEIDSQYRPTLFQCNYPESCLSPYLSQASETMFSSKLTDTLNNTVSLKVSAINIPFSFYNVESNQGNSVYSLSGEQHIPNGYYDLSGLLSQLQTSFLSVSYDSITGKTTLTNTIGSDLQITFYDNQQSIFQDTHINHSLGWMLGFRNITCSGDDIYSSYTISTSITSEYISFIPTIKYFVVTADDHNHNQSSKSLVQLSQGKEYIKPTPYYNNDTSTYRRSNTCTTTTTIHNEASNSLCLDSLSKNDLISTNYDHHKLTKKQLYTRASINDTNQESSLKIEQHAMSNILAIIPFEAKSLTWGQSTFFSDKNQYAREYHGPVDIEKLSIRLYDDKGHILNLNGQDWSMTLLSKHLYKY